jgi:hypothetical protein
MRVLLSLVCALGLITFGWADDEKKEVTLKGEVTCGKCDLKKTEKCNAVLIVKDGDSEEIYYFDADSQKKHGDDCCKEKKKATITGTVKEKDGKKWVSVTKITVDKIE